MENDTTELEQEQIEETTEEVETPTTEDDSVDYKELYEAERKERNKLKNKLYSKEPEPRKGITNRSSDAKKWEILELKTEGYKDKEELDFIMENGGVKALEKPYVIAAVKSMREQKAAQAAVLGNEGAKSSVEKQFTPQEFSKLSSEEQLKLASTLN